MLFNRYVMVNHINHNRVSSERRCAVWPCPRSTALSHCAWIDAPESIKGFNHVSRHLPRGRLQDGDGGHPERASAASLRAWSEGVCSQSLTTWPESATRRVLMMTPTHPGFEMFICNTLHVYTNTSSWYWWPLLYLPLASPWGKFIRG